MERRAEYKLAKHAMRLSLCEQVGTVGAPMTALCLATRGFDSMS